MIPAILALKRFWPLALSLAAFGAGCVVTTWYWQAKQAAALQEEINAREAQERLALRVSTELEEKLATERMKATQLARRLDRELQDAAYRCALPERGVRLLQDAVSGSPAREPDRPVP